MLGRPTEEVGNGWIYYERFVPERRCLGGRSVSLGLQFVELRAVADFDVKGKDKKKNGEEEPELKWTPRASQTASLQAVRIMPAVESSKNDREEAMNKFIIQAR